MNNIENRIDFWRDFWSDLIDNFLKKSFGLTLYNPHILIDNIITEIEENGLKNPDNKKLFYSKLSEYLSIDPVINKRIKSKFQLLRRTLNSERIGYSLELCKEIKGLFKDGLYFDTALDQLINLLNTDKEVDLEFVNSVNYLSQGIIVEFIKKTYDLEDIKKFIINIFDNYTIVHDSILSTTFPHGIDPENYNDDNGEFKREEFNKTVIDIITNLSANERINKLAYYYHKEKIKAYYIFQVEGLKGEIDKTIGSVTFYSLNKRQFITQKKDFDFEDTQRYNGTKKYIQAAVEVDFLMPKSSKREAISKLENSLDILTFYFNTKTNLYINDSYFAVADTKGNLIFTSASRDKRDSAMKHIESLDLKEIEKHLSDLEEYSFLWDNSGNHASSLLKIINALHWYRKAEDSIKYEDKLLNYWISIENLFNLEKDIKLDILNDKNKSKFHLIQETIVSHQILSFVYDYGWELYYYYYPIVNNPFIKEKAFPQDLIMKVQLKPAIGEKVYLKNFIINLDEILSYEKNLFIIDKIKTVKEFYNNSSKTKKVIEDQIQDIKDDILMGYRFRNLVVHNAHFDDTILPYYVWKLRSYSGKLIRRLISDFKNNIDTPEIIIRLHIDKEEFLCDLDNGIVNLFKD